MIEVLKSNTENGLEDFSFFKVFNQGIRISKLTAKLSGIIDLTIVLGRLQRQGLLRIVFDPSIDNEPVVQVTEKGKQEAILLLTSLKQNT